MSWIEESTAAQLGPVLFWETIAMTKGLADVRCVARVGGLFLLLLRKDVPIYNRTVRDHLSYSWIERSENRGGPAEASTDYVNVVWGEKKRLSKRSLANSFRQFVDDVAQVLCRRLLQKATSTFPCASPSRINHPISFLGKKLCQRLFSRNGRHAIAENDQFLTFCRSRRRQELSDDFSGEPGSIHVRAVYEA